MFMMVSIFAVLLAIAVGVSPPPPVQLTEMDSGETVKLNSGGTMEVKLKGNPTTGYTWTVAVVDLRILIQMGEAKFDPETNARGAGGTITIRFKAVAVGKTSLKLIYHRPFEKEKPPLKAFAVDVEVR